MGGYFPFNNLKNIPNKNSYGITVQKYNKCLFNKMYS